MRTKYLLGCATIVAGGLLAPGMAGAQTLGPLVKASGGTPFNHCTADQAATQPGTNFAGSAIEPWIAADPTTQGHLLTGTQQDRWTNGGARGLQAAVTVNGGQSYVKTQPQGVSLCTGGKLQRSTDPWTAFDLNGTAYFFSLAFNNNPSTFVNGESALYVSRSTDGGASWHAPVTLIDDTDPLAFNDKNSITADPALPGYVYAVWDRLYGPPYAFVIGSDENSNSGSDASAAVASDSLDNTRKRVAAARAAAAAGKINPNNYFGPAYYARSTDSGKTFERAVPIYDPGRSAQTIGNVIAVTPDGTVFDFFTQFDKFGNLTIQSVRSKDHGFSFSKKPVLAVPANFYGSGQAVTPDSKQAIRQADIIFSVSVDQSSGLIALAWEQKLANLTHVYYSQSYDGDAWSAPVRIDQTPTSAASPLRGEAFNMAVAAGANNTLVATYYDFRNDVGTPGQELADMWAVFCTNTKPGDCARAKNWGREVRMTNTSFNYLTAPLTSSGYFLGDYFGLIAQGQTVTSAFTATNGTPGQTNLYTRAISLAAVTASR